VVTRRQVGDEIGVTVPGIDSRDDARTFCCRLVQRAVSRLIGVFAQKSRPPSKPLQPYVRSPDRRLACNPPPCWTWLLPKGPRNHFLSRFLLLKTKISGLRLVELNVTPKMGFPARFKAPLPPNPCPESRTNT